MDRATIAAVMANPATFRQHLQIDTDAGPRKLADVVDAWQADDFAALDAGWMRCIRLPSDGGCSRAYLERPRGHSKTADLAVMASYALFAARRQISGVAAAADKDQARLLRDAIAKLVAANAWLAQVIDVQAYRVVNRHTGSTLDILASDAASSYGLTPDYVIVDELTHWRGDELWVSLFSAAAKRANAMLVCISNAGTGQGTSWQWRVRSSAASSDDWYFRSLDGCCASWISSKHLAEQRRMLPSIAFDRLWLNRWTTGAGDALTGDDIDAALTRKGPMRRAKPQFVFVAGLDIGISRDASAFVVVGRHCGCLRDVEDEQPEPVPRHLPVAMRAAIDLGWMRPPEEFDDERRTWRSQSIKPTGRLRVASVQVWKPGNGQRVDLASVERAILAAHEKFGLAEVAFDPHQAEHLAQRLERRGIAMRRVPFSGANLTGMASAVLEAFNERRIDMFDHPQLLADLRGLRIEERSYGCRLVSPRTSAGHGDAGTGLALAILSAQDQSATFEDRWIEGDLVFSVRH